MAITYSCVMFAQLPPEDERRALLDALAELVDRRGPEPLLTWPILFATPEHFPDDWTPDLDGVRLMLLRLMQYAGLGELDAQVEVFVDEDRGPALLDGVAGEYSHRWHGTAAWFHSIQEKTCVFGVELSQIADPEQLVGVLAHEVAHAYRAHHGLVIDDQEYEEQLTDLTTVFLGFGVLTANAADRSRSSGELNGAMVTHRWQREQAGYLSPASMAFLLAAQVIARGNDRATRRRVRGALETNQASSFGGAVSWLARREDEVRRQLGARRGVTARPAPAPIRTTFPRVGDEEASPPQLEGEQDAPQPRAPVFRYRLSGFRLVGRMLFAALVGVVMAIPLKSLWTLAVLPALWFAAERWMFRPLCSGCDARVGASASVCDGCDGVVAGNIDRLRDRHDAEDRYWAEHGDRPDPLITGVDDVDEEDAPPRAAGDVG